MFKKNLDGKMGKTQKIIKNLEMPNKKFLSLISWLFSDSISMTYPQKAGFLFLVLIFVVIISPIAASPSDPYHLHEYSIEIQNSLLFLEKMFNAYGLNNSDDSSYNYEIIDGIKYRVLFSGKLDAKNPDGGRHLIPGFNDIIKSQRF